MTTLVKNPDGSMTLERSGTPEQDREFAVSKIDAEFAAACESLIPDVVTAQCLRLGLEIDPVVAEKMDAGFNALVKARAQAMAELDKATTLDEVSAVSVVIEK